MKSAIIIFMLKVMLSAVCTMESEYGDASVSTSVKSVDDLFAITYTDAPLTVSIYCPTDRTPHIGSDSRCHSNYQYSHCPASSPVYTTYDGRQACGKYNCSSNRTLTEIDKCKTNCSYYGAVEDGDFCRQAQSYNYKSYFCESNLNSQGFDWILSEVSTNDGSKVDYDTNSRTNLRGDVWSHDGSIDCQRTYQACDVECESPLVYDSSTNTCSISYEDMCIEKGMDYNATSGLCEEQNQCAQTEAFKDNNSSSCMMFPNCGVTDGICAETPNKTCIDSNYTYSYESGTCENSVQCSSSQIVLPDGRCGGEPSCSIGDTETIDDCINTTEPVKSCSPYARSGNKCYVSSNKSQTSDVSLKRPLQKATFSGSYKEGGYGTIIGTLCADDTNNCEFRLTKIYSANDGKMLCFSDAQGVDSCVQVAGECSFNGSIDYENGIKQLRVEGSNNLVAYNLQDSVNSIGSIQSTCSLSGKVGSIDGISVTSDIMSITTDGSDLKFWDKYQRGFIGVISMLPTIPQQDYDDGYSYVDEEVFTLLNKGFTGFYSDNDDAVYAVYNGLTSRSNCQSIINGTGFYIPQAINSTEEDILKGLSLKSGTAYNYNDGDSSNGSCVIKSQSSLSFSLQEYSEKTVMIEDSGSVFVCSPLTCKDHSCQYNQCSTGYSPTIYEQTYFDAIMEATFPLATQEQVCIDDVCDANLPNFAYCGNKYGCETKSDIYQQSDGTCVQVSCALDEQLDPKTGKCISYGCKNSVERSGKCYRTLY